MSFPSTPRYGRQDLTQTQALRQQQALSPQQVLYVRLLGLNALEMEDEVRRAMDENPALETAEGTADMAPEELEGKLPPADDDTPFTESAESLQLSDFRSDEDVPFLDYSEAAERLTSPSGRIDPSGRVGENNDSASLSSVNDHLTAQLAELSLTPRQKLIGRHIIGNIDDNGYITASLRQIADEIAIHDAVDVTPDEVNTVFRAIRTLDPAGIGAVDLRDCLLMQLRRREIADPSPAVATAREMVADYFDLFSKRHFDRLCSALAIDRKQLQKAIDVVRSLNPKPGSVLSGSRADEFVNQITPDFIIDSDGHTIDLQMTDSVPSLRIESSFDIDDAALPPRRKGTPDAAAFIRSRRDEAAAYIHAISLRRQTLYRVMRAIISLQRDFFLSDGDPSTLRPMILRDVAAVTGDDISVVSRATAGKYAATRWGTYPLKFFFNEAPNPEIGDSSIKIIETIRDIISHENPSAPYSDEDLAAMLLEKGYRIARRTVAKYRERASIPVARLRRRL